MPFGPAIAGLVFVLLCLRQHLLEEDKQRKADEKKKKEKAKEQEKKAELLLKFATEYYAD